MSGKIYVSQEEIKEDRNYWSKIFWEFSCKKKKIDTEYDLEKNLEDAHRLENTFRDGVFSNFDDEIKEKYKSSIMGLYNTTEYKKYFFSNNENSDIETTVEKILNGELS